MGLYKLHQHALHCSSVQSVPHMFHIWVPIFLGIRALSILLFIGFHTSHGMGNDGQWNAV